MIKPSKVKFISEKLEMAFNSLLDEDPIKKSIINFYISYHTLQQS